MKNLIKLLLVFIPFQVYSQLPDLELTRIENYDNLTEFIPGNSYELNVVITNIGDAVYPADPTHFWYCFRNYEYSYDPNTDTLVRTPYIVGQMYDIPSLAPGNTFSQTILIDVPTETFDEDWYFHVSIQNHSEESNDYNNNFIDWINPTNLKANYSMNDYSSSKKSATAIQSGEVIDESLNDVHGTLVNGASLQSGLIGEAVSLDGVNDQIRVSDYSHFNMPDGFTLITWVNPSMIKSHNSILSKVNPNRDFDLKLTRYGNPNVHIHNGVYKFCTSPDPIPINHWSHIAAVYNRYELKIYVDGVLKNTKDLGGVLPPWTGTRVCIGAMNYYEVFTGLIDDVKVLSKILTDQDIMDDYNLNSYRVALYKSSPIVCALNSNDFINAPIYEDADSTTLLKEIRNTFNIYPTITSDYITIELNEKQESGYLVEIINNAGVVIRKEKYNQAKQYIDFANLSAGLYLVKISYNNNTHIEKILKR
ncbi:LamG-like jellyroll fold domain-containing protein [Bacteroidota bacterium]